MTRPLKCECGTCSTCQRRERGRRYREAHRESYNAYQRDWYGRPENTQRHRQTVRRSRERRLDSVREYDRSRPKVRDPEKERARQRVRTAIENGSLSPQPCEVCGATPSDAHHDDYSQPLDVRWLCKLHHGATHQRLNPVEVAA